MIERLKPLAQRWLPASLPRPSPATLSRLLPVVLLALALTALGMMYLHHADSRYKPVFGAQEKVVAADVMSVLDAEGIPYRLHPDTGQVLVPDSRLGQVRMLLAARGVVARLPDGLEVVDQKDPLGVSQFVQDVRFRRGLEGELVQSIVTLDPVQSARVHLSVAKSSSFILSDGDKSSASVVLALKPGRRLNKEQVAAIIAMVSGSVANLDPARVSVVDQAGNFLSAGVDLASPHGGDNSELATRVREETLRNIQDLLGPTLGDGNFRASVAVEVDQDRIEETREQYGEAPRVTQEATREENDSGVIPLGVPGSLSNRPVAVAGAANDAPEGPRSQKNALTRQYVYDRNVVQIRRSPVRLKRLSVAVVLKSPPKKAPAARRMPECPVALAMQVADVKDGERFDRLQVVARCPETGTEGRFTVRASAGVAGVVAREELLAGEPLQPSALQMAEQDLAALPDLLLSPEEARGFSSRRTLRPGQPLRRSLLQGGSAVGRGQPVRIVAGGRGFQVAIAGTALEDGAVGEVVRIRNASTGRPARATVLGPGVVSLEAQP